MVKVVGSRPAKKRRRSSSRPKAGEPVFAELNPDGTLTDAFVKRGGERVDVTESVRRIGRSGNTVSNGRNRPIDTSKTLEQRQRQSIVTQTKEQSELKQSQREKGTLKQQLLTKEQVRDPAFNPGLTVTGRPEPKGFIERGERALSSQRARAETERARGDERFITQTLGGPVAGFGASLLGTAAFLGSPVSSTVGAVRAIPEIPSALQKVGPLIRSDPGFAFGFISGEALTAKGAGTALQFSTAGGRTFLTRVSPKFTRFDGGLKDLQTSVGATDVKKAGPVSQIALPVSEQIKLEGQIVDAVSAQRGLFSRGTKEILVDKPLPTPDSPALERAFFADPFGRVRVSRLGIEDSQRASLIDVLSGDVQFGRPKPQILVFPEQKVSKLPSDISKSLRSGKSLTTEQSSRLLKQQLSPKGQFDPVGFLSREPEVTLAPGEVIVRQSKIGKTLINNKPVDIFEAGVRQGNQQLVSSLQGAGKTLSESSSLAVRPAVSRSGLSGGVSGGLAPSADITITSPTTSLSSFSSDIRSPKITSGSISPSIISFSGGPISPRPTRTSKGPRGSSGVKEVSPLPSSGNVISPIIDIPTPRRPGPKQRRLDPFTPSPSPFLFDPSKPGQDPFKPKRRRFKDPVTSLAPLRSLPPTDLGPSFTGLTTFQLTGATGDFLPKASELGSFGLSPRRIRAVPKKRKRKKK